MYMLVWTPKYDKACLEVLECFLTRFWDMRQFVELFQSVRCALRHPHATGRAIQRYCKGAPCSYELYSKLLKRGYIGGYMAEHYRGS